MLAHPGPDLVRQALGKALAKSAAKLAVAAAAKLAVAAAAKLAVAAAKLAVAVAAKLAVAARAVSFSGATAPKPQASVQATVARRPRHAGSARTRPSWTSSMP